MRLIPAAIAALSISQAGLGQTLQHFEVAVIRPTAARAGEGTSVNVFEGGRIRITNEPVKLLLRLAFQMQNAQIAGGPAWLDTDRYDIEAKTGRPERIPPDQMSPLMRGLLEERFHLKFHRETRELPVYALVIAKSGPKLNPKAEGESSSSNTTTGPTVSRLAATAESMQMLARYVGNRLGRIVVDKTGLTSSYNFTLDWAPEQAGDASAPSLVTALREQLGLRLESQESPMEVLVIDGIDRPSEN